MIITWDSIKRAAKASLNKMHPIEGMKTLSRIEAMKVGTFDLKLSFDDQLANALNVVDQWEIRHSEELLKVFPESVPRKFRGVTPSLYTTDSGKWVLDFYEADDGQHWVCPHCTLWNSLNEKTCGRCGTPDPAKVI